MEEKVLFEGQFLENNIFRNYGIAGIVCFIIGLLNQDTNEDISFTMTLIAIICIVVAIIALFLFGFGNYKMTITDKRVTGRIKFGKRVDLPIDSISAIGLSIFKSIAITTPSGAIKFIFMKNRDEAYNTISKLIRDRQSTKNITVIQEPKSTSSSADELKKFKDLLDSGVITQEEFDAKKKQLLGL